VRGSMQFLPVDAFRVNTPDLFGNVMGLPVIVNGVSATGNFEVFRDCEELFHEHLEATGSSDPSAPVVIQKIIT